MPTFKPGQQFLERSDVEVMRALGRGIAAEGRGRRAGGAGKFVHRFDGYQLGRGRREVARVGGMKRRSS